jgi:hypothetical protein
MEEHVFELRSSAMFPIGDLAVFAEQDKLDFISHALQAERQFDNHYERGVDKPPSMQIYRSSQRPFIRVSRGGRFTDALSPDYFPKTFPTYFPYSRGGPYITDENEVRQPTDSPLRKMTVETWVKAVL